MATGLFILVLTIGVVVAIYVIATTRRLADEAWTTGAERLGLRYTPVRRRILGSRDEMNRHLRGAVDGRKVRVYTFTEGSGDSRRTYTGYKIGFPALGLGLKITEQGFWSKVRKAFGSQDVEVGHEEFDEAFLVKGDQPDRIAAFLTPSKRVTVSRLVTEYRGARVGDDHIWWRSRGVERDADAIVTTVRRLAAAGNELAMRPRPKLDEALEVQRQGDLAAAAQRAREAVGESPDLETTRTVAEVLYTEGSVEEAAEAFDRLAAAMPGDAQVLAWQERIALRRAGADRPPPQTDTTSTEPGEIADELFDRDNLSFDTTRRFEDEYQGTAVQWTGTLVRARGYRSDLDFRDGPGTKAVFHVHTLSNDLYAGRNVEAVVELPAGADDALRGRRGEEFTFTGTLHRVDALMRNLYVRSGRLVGDDADSTSPAG